LHFCYWRVPTRTVRDVRIHIAIVIASTAAYALRISRTE
jgi:hypothetical protein